MSSSSPGILVTGANGFIGSALCAALAASGWRTRQAVREARPDSPAAVAVGEIDAATDWRAALTGMHCVVHLAGHAHTRATAAGALAEYRRVNVAGTERLARAAGECGIRRLVFLSSIKVNGERTTARPYAEDDAPRPEDAYGVSKWEAEQALRQIAARTGLECVILRPPLVYGAGVKGNFLRLLGLVARSAPLPFASLDNRRSLVYLYNLCDAIRAALVAPRAAGRTYLVSDGEDVSTPGLIRAIGQALAVEPRLFPCPPAVLRALAAALGRSAEAARLTGSLQIDASRIRSELAWQPPHTLAQGLAETARWYRER